MSKKTIVFGASTNPNRYSYLAVVSLSEKGNEVVPIGKKRGQINGIKIINDYPDISDVDTITIYMRDTIQQPFHSYILALKPKRIIFNPGAENQELEALAQQHNIETLNACTLVMLSTGQY